MPKTTSSLIRFEFSPGELTTICDHALETAKTQLDQLAVQNGAQKIAPPNNSALLDFEKILADLSDVLTPLHFMGYVSTKADLRKEASACEERSGQFTVSVFTRKDLYEVLKQAEAKNREQKRLRHETLKAFEKNGLALSEEKLNQVRELKKKLSSLETKFAENLNQDKTQVAFSREELAGMNEDFFARLSKDGSGKYLVPAQVTNYTQVMENASNPESRKRMLLAFTNKGGEANTHLLEEAVEVREKIAELMGFKTWADYRTQDRMAKSGDEVMNFLRGLKGKLALRYQKDFDQLLKYKKETEPTASTLNPWDVAYLAYQLRKRDFSLDDDEIRNYFPADHVMKELFEVYSTLLGVKFQPVESAKVWAPEVKLYKIIDDAEGRTEESKTIGYFYTDFVPREGKYGHAAAFPLIAGRLLESRYSKPVSAIVANFNPPSGGKPSLLNHDEVETLFHEFGHIMHQTLTRAPYASLSGSGVTQDFVEAPSQMLENWVWDKSILNLLSGHYQDTNKKLPPSLLEKMIAVRDFNQGYFYTRQLLFGFFDMELHTAHTHMDSVKTYDRLYKEIMHIEPIPGNRFAASFGHLMGGYDAGYYGYLWSEVYAQDMFTQFENGKILDSKMGLMYRKNILEPGNMADAMDLIKKFLGREPSKKAFFKKLGIH